MTLAAQSVVAALNHLLAREAWARERLAPYAGYSVCIITPLIRLGITVQTNGLVAPRPKEEEDQPYAVSITLPLAALSAILTQGQAALSKYVKVEGDAEFAATLGFLAQHLRWEIEEDLAQLIGDAPASQLSQMLRAGHQQVRRTLRHLVETTAEYWLDENPTLVRHVALTEFATEISTLRDAVARLEKRVGRTEASACQIERFSNNLQHGTSRSGSTKAQPEKNSGSNNTAADHSTNAPVSNAPINR